MTTHLLVCTLGVLVLIAGQANASLVGGTYTNAGAPGATWSATSASTGSALQYQSMTNPSSTNGATNQGYTAQDSSNTGTILGEIVTPTATFNLDTISVVLGGAATLPTGLSLHLFTLGTASTPLSTLASSGSAFYFVNSNLLGAGAGLAFNSGGVASKSVINFTLDNVGTSDVVTLNAGTSYAIELWNQTSPYSATALTWFRTSDVDPNGQGFAKQNTTNTASRNTLSANGLAGGAPRTFEIALYGTVAAVPETSSFLLGAAVCSVVGLGYFVRRGWASLAAQKQDMTAAN